VILLDWVVALVLEEVFFSLADVAIVLLTFFVIGVLVGESELAEIDFLGATDDLLLSS
jgi:hypothetical protein